MLLPKHEHDKITWPLSSRCVCVRGGGGGVGGDMFFGLARFVCLFVF